MATMKMSLALVVLHLVLLVVVLGCGRGVDSTVSIQWVRQINSGNGSELARQGSVALDVSQNHVYVCGYTNGSMSPGGATSQGSQRDGYLRKYRVADGALAWQMQWGSSDADIAWSLATDSNDYVYVSGYSRGARGWAPNTIEDGSTGSYDNWVTKLTPSGSIVWTYQGRSAASERGTVIALDKSNHIYVTGYTTGDAGTTTSSSRGANGYDPYVYKLNTAGTHAWTFQLGCSSNTRGYSVAVDLNNDVYVCGHAEGDIPSYTFQGGRYDAFVMKVNASGELQWVKQYGTLYDDSARGVTTDAAGFIYISGHTKGDFRGSKSLGQWYTFVVKLDSSGTEQYAKRYIPGQAADIAIRQGILYVTIHGVLSIHAATGNVMTRLRINSNKQDYVRGLSLKRDDAQGYTTGTMPDGGAKFDGVKYDAFLAGLSLSTDTAHLQAFGTPVELSVGSLSSNYSSNLNRIWTICLPSVVVEGVVVVQFTRFDTEYMYDFMYMYDGNATSSPVVPSMNGISGTTLPPQVTSSGRCITIWFTSDTHLEKQGWALQYHGVAHAIMNTSASVVSLRSNHTDNTSVAVAGDALILDVTLSPLSLSPILLTVTLSGAQAVVEQTSPLQYRATAVVGKGMERAGNVPVGVSVLGLALAHVTTDDSSVYIEDTSPPLITCPSDITVEATSASGVVAKIPSPTTMDNIGKPSLSCSHSPNATFPIGNSTVVRWTATDSMGLHASCFFRITVTDTLLVIPSYDAEISSSPIITVMFGCPAQPIRIPHHTKPSALVDANCLTGNGDVVRPHVHVLPPLGYRVPTDSTIDFVEAPKVVLTLRDVPEGVTCQVVFLPMDSGPCNYPARFRTRSGVAVVAGNASSSFAGTFLKSYDILDSDLRSTTRSSYKQVMPFNSGLWWQQNLEHVSTPEPLLSFSSKLRHTTSQAAYPQFQQVATGFKHSCSLTSDGGLVCWGGETSVPSLPAGVSWTSVAAGWDFTCALKTSGDLECFGSFASFLGVDIVPSLPPGVIWVAVSAFGEHACGLRDDGLIACWGSVAEGGLGSRGEETGPQLPSGVVWTAVSAGNFFSCGLRSDNQVVCWGDETSDGQTLVPSLPPGVHWTAISAGYRHVCGLASDNQLVCWGSSDYNQTRVPVLPPGVVWTAVSVGDNSCAQTTRGSVECWGANFGNQTEVPALPSGVTWSMISVGWGHICGLRSDNQLVCWGSDNNNKTRVPVHLPMLWTAICAGERHTCGLRADGGMECWSDQLMSGSPPLVPSLPSGVYWTAVACGGGHTCGLRSDGNLTCFGAFGWPTNYANATVVPSLPSGVIWTAVCATGSSRSGFCGLLSNGTVLRWGASDAVCVCSSNSSHTRPTNESNLPMLWDGSKWIVEATTNCNLFCVRRTCWLSSVGVLACERPSPYEVVRAIQWGRDTSRPLLIDNSNEQAQVKSSLQCSLALASIWGLPCTAIAEAVAVRAYGEFWLAAQAFDMTTPVTLQTPVGFIGRALGDCVFRPIPGQSSSTPPTLRCLSTRGCFNVAGTGTKAHFIDLRFELAGTGSVGITVDGASVTFVRCSFVSSTGIASRSAVTMFEGQARLVDSVLGPLTLFPASAAIHCSDQCSLLIAGSRMTHVSGGAIITADRSVVLTTHTTITHCDTATGAVELLSALWASLNDRHSISTGRLLHASTSPANSNVPSTVLLRGMRVSGCSTSGEGGAIVMQTGSLGIHDSDISNNTANLTSITTCDTVGGGGLSLMASSYALLNGASLHNNRAILGCGGAVVCSDCTLEVYNSTVSNNEAVSGGGLCATGGGSISMLNGSTVVSNSASESGGGVLLFGAHLVLSSTTSVAHNTAQQDGGGVFGRPFAAALHPTVVAAAGATIAHNTASFGGGGGVFLEGVGIVPLQTLSAVASVQNNTAMYGADRSDGPQVLSVMGPVPSSPYELRQNFDPPFSVVLMDSFDQAIVVADQYAIRNLRPAISVSLNETQVQGFSTSNLLGQLKVGANSSGVATFSDLQYGGDPAPALQLLFAASVVKYDGSSQELVSQEPIVINVTGCPAGTSITDGTCQVCPLGSYSNAFNVVKCPACPDGTFGNETNLTSCHDCAENEYTKQGATECLTCAAGRFLNASQVCSECAAGHYADGSGHSKCKPCPAGSAAALPGSVGCQYCTEGSYSAEEGSATCSGCPAGSFSNITNASTCFQCNVGTIAPNSGASTCTVCAAGTFAANNGSTRCKSCDAGRVNNHTGLSFCYECPEDRITPGAGMTVCRECGFGSEASEDKSTCTSCPIGQYRDAKSGTSCQKCRPGTYARTANSRVCLLCGKGKATNATGATTCEECERHTIAAQEGQAVCTHCGRSEYTNGKGESECKSCSATSYARFEGGVFIDCAPCPSGADCRHGVVIPTRNQFLVRDEATGAVSVFACSAHRCSEDGQCVEGRLKASVNPLCGQCQAPLSEWNNQCVACNGVNWGAIFGLVLLSLAVVLLMVRVAQRSTGSLGILTYFTQSTFLFLRDTEVWAQWLGVFNMEPFESTGSTCIFPISQLNRTLLGLWFPVLNCGWLMVVALIHWLCTSSHCFAHFKCIKRCFVAPSLFPLSSAFPHGLVFRSDTMQVETVRAGSPADVAGVQAGDFVVELNGATVHSQKDLEHIWYNQLMPRRTSSGRRLHNVSLVIMREDACTQGWICESGDSEQESNRPPAIRAFTRTFEPCCYVRAALALWLLAFNAIVRTVLEFFDCIQLPGNVRLLEAYPAVDCDSPAYKQLVPLVAISGTLVGLLVPLILVGKLRGISNKMNLTERKWFGVLYEPFKPQVWFWKFVILCRQITLVATVVLQSHNAPRKWAILALLNMCYMLLHFAFLPYVEPTDNIFETLSLPVLTVISVAMTTVRDREKLSENSSALLGTLVMVVVAILVVFVSLTKLRRSFVWVDRVIRWLEELKLPASDKSSASVSLFGRSSTVSQSASIELQQTTAPKAFLSVQHLRSSSQTELCTNPVHCLADSVESLHGSMVLPSLSSSCALPLDIIANQATTTAFDAAEFRQSVGRRESVVGGLPSGWTVELTDESVPYYVHQATGMVQWEKPRFPELDIIEVEEEED